MRKEGDALRFGGEDGSCNVEDGRCISWMVGAGVVGRLLGILAKMDPTEGDLGWHDS